MAGLMKYTGEEPFRGRPRGRQSHSTMYVLDSIAHIAASHSLDPRLLLDAFGEARIHKQSDCGALEVICRDVSKEAATFMVTSKDQVLAQFSVGEEILQSPEFFKSHIPILPTPVQLQRDGEPLKSIGELRPAMRGVSVNARVVEIQYRRQVMTRYGWYAIVADVLLADETGSMRLSLWNSQIDEVSVGDAVSIEGASVTRFHGELQLRIARNGKLTVVK